ncbi:MAG: hypothetical protein V3U24_02975 [Candidatus Neomarinimicrobiota bacterium]
MNERRHLSSRTTAEDERKVIMDYGILAIISLIVTLLAFVVAAVMETVRRDRQE